MTHRDALVLSSQQMPIGELWAMRLDGDLFPVADSFAAIDEFDTPLLRATAVAEGKHPRSIAERWTAAWVWGALPAPPPRHTFCVRLDARIGHVTSDQLVVREVVIDTDEEQVLGPLRVTSILRTATDLARSTDAQHDVIPVIARLFHVGSLTLDECLAALERRPHLPHKRRAEVLLRQAGCRLL